MFCFVFLKLCIDVWGVFGGVLEMFLGMFWGCFGDVFEMCWMIFWTFLSDATKTIC